MAVHGRYRQPCPVCGSPVQRVVYAANEANYCATCQTGGRLLADRSLSRLLRDDWPGRSRSSSGANAVEAVTRRAWASLEARLIIRDACCARRCDRCARRRSLAQVAVALRRRRRGGAPFMEADPNDTSRVVGFEVDVAALLAAGLGRTPRFVQVGFATLDPAVAPRRLRHRAERPRGPSGPSRPARRHRPVLRVP
jgi:hypothetical protein